MARRRSFSLFPGVIIVLCGFLSGLAGVEGQDGRFSVDVCGASTQWFDPNALQCIECAVDRVTGLDLEGRVADSDDVDVLTNPAGCTCAPGYRTVTCAPGASECKTTCESCVVQGLAASADGSVCMNCGNLTLDTALNDCLCPENYALVDRDPSGALLQNKTCSACPSGTRVFTADTADGLFEKDLYTCQGCPEHMIFSGDVCICDSANGWKAAGEATYGEVTCVDAAVEAEVVAAGATESLATTVIFSDVLTASNTEVLTSVTVAPSLPFKHLFMQAATRCWAYHDEEDSQYCAALANLCVMQHYSAAARACVLYTDLATVRADSLNGWGAWPLYMPFIQYGVAETAPGIMASTALSQTMSFDEISQQGTFENLDFRLVRYSLDGKLLGVEELGWQFIFCGGGSQGGITSRPRWLKFGVSYAEEIDCDLRALLGSDEPELYDLYIVDSQQTQDQALEAARLASLTSTATTETVSTSTSLKRDADALPVSMFPVPFRNENYQAAGAVRPNANIDGVESDDILARRFFLYDTISGIRDAGADPEVMRYADTITLTISSQAGTPAKIHPPVLSIHYSERKPSTFASDPSLAVVKVRLQVQYTTDVTTFWTTATAFFAICIVMSVMFCSIRIFNWQRRATRVAEERWVDLAALIRAFVYFAGVFATVMFFFVFVFSSYWLLFFKLQDKVFALMPADTPRFRPDYESHQLLVTMCFIGSLIRVIEIVYTQTNVDVFFTDWERPRSEDPDLELGAKGGPDDDDRRDHRGRRDRGDPPKRQELKKRAAPLSIWRTILISNEWSEIQVERKTHLMFTIIVLLALLRGAGLEYIATEQPTVKNLDPGTVNPVLHFSNVCFWWGCLVFVQYVWNWAIWERFITESPVTRFIDIATVAKISCLVMDDKYHGYYLHCRSPNPFADGTMAELIKQLSREAEGMSTIRGLDGCPAGKECQTFELFVSKNWRVAYDNIYRKVVDADLLKRTQAEGAAASSRKGQQPSQLALFSAHARTVENSKEMLKAARKLGAFVRAFIEQTGHYKREWPAHGQPSYLAKVMNTPPHVELGGVNAPAMMYPDMRYKFERVMFRGVELDLVIFNMLTFAVCDLWWGNSLVSAIFTVLVDELLKYIRLELGTRNIAVKTMVDARFLS